MAKIVDIKKYQKREKINKILLYCVDNKMETRYITAEFKKQNLLIRFTHFNHLKKYMDLDYIYVFTSKEANNFVKMLAENKSNFLYKLQKLFNTASACQDLIQYADNHSIKYRLIDSNNYDDGNEIFRYNFDDIYEGENRLYYSNGELIIPTLYKHPKNGVIKIYLPSGYLYMEISYKNNLKDGMTKCYFKDSKQIDWKQNYTKDKLNGITKSYLRNGILLKEETFVNGVKQGWDNSYNEEDGYLETKEMYANNKKNGKALKYYPNGQIKHEAYFKNDKQTGETKQYYETGELELIAEWKNDKPYGKRITFYKNGNKRAETIIKNNIYVAEDRLYYENGKIKAILPAYDDGISVSYFKNGKVKQTTTYKKGKKHGKATAFYCNGTVSEILEFNNDKRTGKDIGYYKNGEIHYECNYKNGLRDGYSFYYDKNCKLIQKVLYKNGKVVDFHGNNGIIGVKNLDVE